jgi:glyoxalase family protein
MHLNGLHHITAVSARIADNLHFYTQVLGLRLVKKSVNQDDVSAYHLFYADKLGSPGTDMTFFDWSHIGPNQTGTDSITGTVFRVFGEAALDFWAERLAYEGARNIRREQVANLSLLAFEDPEGQRLYLADDEGAPFQGEIWPRSDIPEEFALRGFYSVILSVPRLRDFSPTLEDILNFQELGRTQWMDGETTCAMYASGETRLPGNEVWVLEERDADRARLGAGGIHHVAYRVSTEEDQKIWRRRLSDSGLSVTPIIDRFWFRSIYFRVRSGILFEIATDGPGFAIDEDPDALGRKLVLPPFLESRREEIEAGLKPIKREEA